MGDKYYFDKKKTEGKDIAIYVWPIFFLITVIILFIIIGMQDSNDSIANIDNERVFEIETIVKDNQYHCPYCLYSGEYYAIHRHLKKMKTHNGICFQFKCDMCKEPIIVKNSMIKN